MLSLVRRYLNGNRVGVRVSGIAFAVSAPSGRNQGRYAKLVRRDSWIAFVGLAPLVRKQGWYAEFLRLLSLYQRHLDGIRDGMRSFLDGFRRNAEFLGWLSQVRHHLNGTKCGA